MGKPRLFGLAFAPFLFGMVAATCAHAQGFTNLVNFNRTNGAGPNMALVQGTDGNFYGTTYDGGAKNAGTIFRMTASGELTTLYSFCTQTNCPDGSFLYSGLVQGTDGNYYGTTVAGGANGEGTVYKITPGGVFTRLHSFNSTDGAQPWAGLTQGTDGRFYGTTSWGGAYNNGTIFRITPEGILTTLYSFCAVYLCPDGSTPFGGLVQGADGNFYGTTTRGGVSESCSGCGTVFEIAPSGKLATLHSFTSIDGSDPLAGLIQAADGNFYGNTNGGGTNGSGTVFRITPEGDLTVLCSIGLDGAFGGPYGELVQAANGDLYGTTFFGGTDKSCYPYGCGSIFKVTLAGALTTVHSDYGFDGAYPRAGLLQATSGALYGTNSDGGIGGYGTVFSLDLGLPPFIVTQPGSGKVGTFVIILGNNLTGTTRVTFSGIAATFTVVSDSEITTTVPTHAATGQVQVVTPGGTLRSKVDFRVSP
jgi:uncharacterized repeat protein (TIGR03803 family)